ncbi:MAG: hypothetical protein OXS29_09825 [bacterium]|nr:hypothetical protein [bacterium]MDE0287401.1 hypothetical protein [bacterium]MDE0438821.1 hypothetical protein [bacterium]
MKRLAQTVGILLAAALIGIVGIIITDREPSRPCSRTLPAGVVLDLAEQSAHRQHGIEPDWGFYRWLEPLTVQWDPHGWIVTVTHRNDDTSLTVVYEYTVYDTCRIVETATE